MARSGAYLLGRLAGKQFRKAQWMWASATGSEDEAIRAEQAVGRDMAAAVREDARGPVDPAVQAALDDVAAPLAAHVRNRAHRFEVAALAASEPNAFALPGGYIFVAPTIVELAGDRDALAFIVAHEMAHVIRRHAIDRILSQRALKAITLASPAARNIAPWVRTVGVQWLEKAYSRDQEYEADELGAGLLRAARFDPAGAIRMLERLDALQRGGGASGLGGWLSTHPPTADRIRRLRELLAVSGTRPSGDPP